MKKHNEWSPSPPDGKIVTQYCTKKRLFFRTRKEERVKMGADGDSTATAQPVVGVPVQTSQVVYVPQAPEKPSGFKKVGKGLMITVLVIGHVIIVPTVRCSPWKANLSHVALLRRIVCANAYQLQTKVHEEDGGQGFEHQHVPLLIRGVRVYTAERNRAHTVDRTRLRCQQVQTGTDH